MPEEHRLDKTPASSTNLDLIRSLAVLLVIISHLPATQQLADLALGENKIKIQPLGLVGVGIFFVHTCLVLMLSLDRQIAQLGTRGSTIIFLIRRVLRIYPLSITTVLILTAIAYFHGTTEVDLTQVACNILLIQNITGHTSIPGALWSLPYEVQMYLLLPGIYVLASRQRARTPALIMGIWIFSVALILSLHAAGLNYHPIKYFPAFIPGVLAYTLISRASTRRTLPASSPTLFIFLAAIIFPLLVSKGFRENILIWPICLTLGAVIPFSRESRSALAKAIASTIAKYSYGIYLIHGPMIELSFNHLHDYPPIIQWSIFIAGTACISCLAFHLIENPCIRLGRRLTHIAQPSRPALPGALEYEPGK